jgi:hypothetical protein
MKSARVDIAVCFLALALASLGLFQAEKSLYRGQLYRRAVRETDNADVCSKDIPPSPENVEKFDWAYCSFDLQPFWNSLGLTDTEFTDSSSLVEARSVFGDLDRDGTDERILCLTLRNADRKTRFAVLKPLESQSGAHWRTLVSLDLPQSHLGQEARIASDGRASWLAINNDEKAWGTGIMQENETWYELAAGRLVPVLSFPAEMEEVWVARPPIHRHVTSEATGVSFDGNTDRVVVTFRATFGWGDLENAVTIRRKVSFTKGPQPQQFVFDRTNSDVPESTYRAICDLEAGEFTYDVFADFAGKELVALAGASDQGNALVRELLPELSESKRKAELARAVHTPAPKH